MILRLLPEILMPRKVNAPMNAKMELTVMHTSVLIASLLVVKIVSTRNLNSAKLRVDKNVKRLAH